MPRKPEYLAEQRARVKKRYHENAEVRARVRLASRQHYYNLTKKTRLLQAAEYRAQRKGLIFWVTEADLEWPVACPILGISLDYGAVGKKSGSDNSPSIDRWDNAKGYVPGNVFVISYKANSIKRNASAEELRRVAIYAKEGPDGLLWA